MEKVKELQKEKIVVSTEDIVEVKKHPQSLEQKIEEYYRLKQEIEKLQLLMKELREEILEILQPCDTQIGNYRVFISEKEVKIYSPRKVLEIFGLDKLLEVSVISNTKTKNLDKELLDKCVDDIKIERIIKISKVESED